MPVFALVCTDKPGSLALRQANREAHLAHLDADPARVRLAGPLLNEAGDMAGSIILLEVEDLAAAQAFAENDPYAKAGLFQSVTINTYRVARGALG